VNDPNGLVFVPHPDRNDGEWHLFYQHYPDALCWGPMHWGHAASPDLVHWEERPIALHPDATGTMFSGSAVVDLHNTSGLQEGERPVLLAFYTAAGSQVTPKRPFTQCLAYSNDGGNTWHKYAGNPILKHVVGSNRDPKVFWYAPANRASGEGHWVMVLYLDDDTFGLFRSSDALDWRETSRFRVPGNHECPDLFELPVVNAPGERRWIFISGAHNHVAGDCARYVVGMFDGATFTPESEPIPIDSGKGNYSTQTFNGAPDGRRVFVSWFSRPPGGPGYPGMPANAQFRVPWELSLHRTGRGRRLHRLPVDEVAQLRRRENAWQGVVLRPNDFPIPNVTHDGLDAILDARLANGSVLGLSVHGHGVKIDATGAIHAFGRSADAPIADGRLSLRLLIDRMGLEIFSADGAFAMSGLLPPYPDDAPTLRFSCHEGEVRVNALTVHEMDGIWRGD
jgi:sucrose-6-phosphate hydrolase SacC (GH32 family)